MAVQVVFSVESIDLITCILSGDGKQRTDKQQHGPGAADG